MHSCPLRSTWPALALLLLLSTRSEGATGPKIAALDDKWRWVTSSRFEVLTNGPEKRSRDAIEQLEAFRAAIGQLTGGPASDPPQPMRILLFDRIWQMKPYQSLDSTGKPQEWSGYFLSRGDLHYFAMTNEWEEEVPETALTGYAHVLIWKQLGSLPTWLRVGLAEYFSAFRYVARDRQAQLGRPKGEHLRYLNASSHFPLEKLVAIDYDSPEFARDVPRAVFYAKSWLAVHYFQLGSEARAGTLSRFAQLRAQGVGDVAALERAAGCSLAQLDQELAVYQKKSLMSFQSVQLADDPRKTPIEVRPATREEVAYRLGEYLLALDPKRREEARAHFDASGRPEPAAEVASTTVRPQAAAPVRIETKRPAAMAEPPDERSIDELQAAVVAGGASARDRRQLVAAVRELLARDWEQAKARLPAARRGLRELLAESPDNDEDWRQLNFLYRAEQEPADVAEGTSAYEAAMAALPEATWLLRRWAEFAASSGDTARARAAAEAAIARDPTTDIRAAVETVLVDLDRVEANKLLEANRADDGRKLLSARLAASTQASSRDFAQGALTAYDASTAQRAIERQYRAAVALVNAQKVEQGGDALWTFIQEHPDSPYTEQAKRDLEKVDDYLARKRGYRPRVLSPAAPSAPPPPS